MKNIRKILLGAIILSALLLGMNSVTKHRSVSGIVYYGPHPEPWFHDEPWMDGHQWYRAESKSDVGIYLHPPRIRR